MNCTHLGKTPASQLGVGVQGSGVQKLLGPQSYLRKLPLELRGMVYAIVWVLGSCCLFPGRLGVEKMLSSLILYFEIQFWEYPVGWIPTSPFS